MTWLKRLFNRESEEPEEVPQIYNTPWEVVQAFLYSKKYNVVVLEERPGWVRFTFDGLTAEALDDPEKEWLHIRFRLAFTEEQKSSRLDAYFNWAKKCARQTAFRYDVDFEEQEYTADGFAYIHGQYDQIECILLIFNSAKLFYEDSNRIALGRRYDVYINDFAEPSVAMAMWNWLNGPLAPPGTRREYNGWKEEAFWMGSALCSVLREQWVYYALLRFAAGDFKKYMYHGEDMQIRLYELHLDVQRRYPRIRNFVLFNDDPKTNGSQETSFPVFVSHGTNALPIFERCLKEVYDALIDYTEWFHFDFNEETAPWFDHSVKKPQAGYQRSFPLDKH